MAEPAPGYDADRACSTIAEDVGSTHDPATAGSRKALFTCSDVAITVDGDDVTACL